jgi:hypothetical protein
MDTISVKLYSYGYKEVHTYLFASLFIVGNIVLPQLCHLMPQGGLIWLPIYFFTLIAAYKYGIKVGLLTAVLSPVVNCAMFGMPAMAMLPIIIIKSALLATFAGLAANHFHRVSLLIIALVVVSYQLVGMGAEWAMNGSFATAIQDIRLGYPGILVQIIGGFIVLRYLLRK